MADREEKRVEEYFCELKETADKVSDTIMESAVLRGIEQGKRGQVRRRRVYIFAAAMAVILMLFAVLSTFETLDQRAKLARQQPKSWYELEVFRPLAEGNITLKSALDAGYVQHFENAVAESGGYKLTVNGVVADKYGLLLLYTFENTTGEKIGYGSMQLKDADGSSLEYGVYSSSFGGEPENPAVEREMLEVRWQHAGKMKGQLTAELSFTKSPADNAKESRAGEASPENSKDLVVLKVPLTLDEEVINNAGEVIHLNQSITVSGQSIMIKSAVVAPTGLYVNIQDDPANTMEIFNIIEPKVIQGEGEQVIELGRSLTYGDMNGQTMLFGYNNMNPDGPLELSVQGIHALDKSQLDLIVDTEKLKILQAPDDRLSVTRVDKAASSGQFALNYFVKNSGQSYEQTMSSVSLENTFTDGAGKVHDLPSNGSQSTSTADGYTSSAYYDLLSDDLPQPLTFKLNSYPQPILEEQSLKLR